MKRKMIYMLIFTTVILLFINGISYAASFTSYGKLRRNSSEVNETMSIDFRLYNSRNGGSLLWSSGPVNVIVRNGHFSHELDPSSIDWSNTTAFLEFVVDGTALSPRTKITGTPFSSWAQDVADNCITSSKIANGSITNADLSSGTYSNVTGVGTLGSLTVSGLTTSNSLNVDAYANFGISSGNIGIGTSIPTQKFTVGTDAIQGFQVNSTGNLVKTNNITYSWPSSQGSANTVLTNNGSGTLTWDSTGTFASVETTAQGAIQIDPFSTSAGNTGEERFLELAANGTNYIGFKAPDSVAANQIWVLPTADGSSGQALITDGSDALSWSTISAGANTGLSNLASVAVNTSLISDANNTDDLGSSTYKWKDLYLAGKAYLDGGLIRLSAYGTGTNNVFIGTEPASLDAAAEGNLSAGLNALNALTTGDYNVAVGQDALLSNTTGSVNTAFGYYALRANTTADRNTALGYYALAANTTGYQNNAIGFFALESNTTGNYNNAMGYWALGENTTGSGNNAIGRMAMMNNTTGSDNTAMGYSALRYTETGNYNTTVGYTAGEGASGNSFSKNSLFGYRAGYALTTGGNNVLLGYQAGDSITTGTDNIIIGYDEDTPAATTSNHLNIGGTIYGDLSSGYVGVGTASPDNLLDIEKSGTAKSDLDIFHITNTVNAADMDGTETSILFNQYYYDVSTPAVADAGRISVGTETDWTSTASTQDGYMAFETAINGTVTEYMRIKSNGSVGIGITTPTGSLQATGDEVRIGDSGTVSFATADGDLYVEDALEVDGFAYFSSTIMTYSTQFFATSAYFLSEGMKTDDGFHLSIGYDDGYANRHLIITDFANRDKDHDHDTLSSNPTVFIHSATDPDTDNTQWLSLAHDQTDGRIKTGKGNLSIGTGSDSQGLSTPNDLFVTGKLEVNGTTYLDGNLTLATATSPTAAGATWTDLGSVTTIDINGGTINGITDLAVLDGGTGASTASAARTNLGVAIGSNVQAYDAQLDDVAGLTPTDSYFIVGDGANFVAESASTARTSLGLGTIATQAAASVNLDGGTIDGITIGGSSAGAGTFTDVVASGGDVTIGAGTTAYAGRIVLHDADAVDSYTTTLLSNADVGASFSLTLPADDGTSGQYLKVGASGALSFDTPAGSGANTALSNLASVAINTSLLSDTTNTDDLGSAAKKWKDLHLAGYADVGGNVFVGGNIGTTTAEVNNIYIGDDDRVYFGSDQDASIYYNSAGSTFRIKGATGAVYIDSSNLYPTSSSYNIGSTGTTWNTGYFQSLNTKKQGTAKSNLDIYSITNSVNAADMDGTETSILFNQYYYDVSTPAVADAGRISVGTETDWTSTASTQDGYMAFETALDGTVTEYMRLNSSGNLVFEGATADAYETTFAITDPTSSDKTITFPNDTGTVILSGATQTLTNKTLTSPTIGTSPTASGATWTNLGSVTTVDINGGTIDGATIGGSSAGAGTFTDVVAGGGDVTIGTGTTAYAGRIVLHDADAVDSYTTTLLSNADVGASFSLTLPADDGVVSQFLQTNGSGTLGWQYAGDIYSMSAGVTTDNAIVKWHETTGYAVQNSGVIINDSNNITTTGTLSSGPITSTLTATGKVYIDGSTTRTGTTELLDIDATFDTTTATNDVYVNVTNAGRAATDTGGTRGWATTVTTGNMASGEWSYCYGGSYNPGACATATSNAATFYADSITGDSQCNDYGVYVGTGYDFGFYGSATDYGVYGNATGSSGTGVKGSGALTGVLGEAYGSGGMYGGYFYNYGSKPSSSYGAYMSLASTSISNAADSYGCSIDNTATTSGNISPSKYGLNISSQGAFTGGTGTTNNYGIYIQTTSGADSNYDIYAASGAYLSTSGTWTNASSRKFKQQIIPLAEKDYEKMLDTLDDIDLVYYKYNIDVSEKKNKARKHLGIIAEDSPDVITNEEKTGLPTGDAIGYLLAVAKAQQKQIDLLSGEEIEKVLKEAEKTKEGDAVFRNESNNRDLIFEVNQDGELTELMRIDGSTGNIGIGTQSPTAKLDVSGTIKSSGTDSSWTTDDFGVGFQLAQGNALMWSQDYGTISRGIAVSDDKMYFLRSDDDDDSTEAEYDMVIDENGNIGIGTEETADYKLTVAGDIYSDGTIYSSKGFSGYTINKFVNSSGTTLTRGDIVKVKSTGISQFTGQDNLIPIPEVTLTEDEDEFGVVGIVLGKNNTDSSSETVANGEYVDVVISGTFAVCKVTGPVYCGSKLVSSANGYAKEADSGSENPIAVALESYLPGESPTEYISVLVK